MKASWSTALDFDFSALATQNLGTANTNANFSLGGLTWFKESGGNEGTVVSVTSSLGLVFKPAAASTDTTRSWPNLFLSASQLSIPNFSYDTPLRIWAYVTSSNDAAGSDNAVLEVTRNGTLGPSYHHLRGFNGATQGSTSRRFNFAGASGAGTVAQAITNTNLNVIMIHLPAGLSGTPQFTAIGTWSNGWPSINQMRPQIASPTNLVTEASITTIGNDANTSLGFSVGAVRITSTTALVVAFARMRIDYMT